MARDPNIEMRLNRWARWKLGGQLGGLGHASTDMTRERVDGDGWHGAVSPDGEEAITDKAVDTLDHTQRLTVEVVYMDGGKKEKKLRDLGHISAATLDARIWEIHRILAAWFSDRYRQAQDERRRVEALQRAAANR